MPSSRDQPSADTQTNRKRRRANSNDDSDAQPQKSSRLAVQPRKMLQLLGSASPGIPRRAHRDSSRPALFLELRACLSTNIGVGVIPLSLQQAIREHHAEGGLTTPEYAYDTDAENRQSRLWDTVRDLWVHADRCANPTGDENAWSRLVDRILSASIAGSGLLQVHSLYAAPVSFSVASANPWTRQSQSLDETLLPILPTGVLNRKIDYCLTPSFDDSQFSPVYEFLCSRGVVKIGLTKDSVTENLPILFGVEIKKANGDIEDAEVQLKTFFFAFFKRLEHIEEFLERSIDLAALGVLVHGHIWTPYVACRNGGELHVERLPHAITHTETFLGIFSTISFLNRTKEYIEKVMWPSYHRQVIIPLTEKIGMQSTTSLTPSKDGISSLPPSHDSNRSREIEEPRFGARALKYLERKKGKIFSEAFLKF